MCTRSVLARYKNAHSEALIFTRDAIRDTAQTLPKSCAFHVWHEYVRMGTTPVLHMSHDPEILALRVKLLHRQFWG